MDRAAIGQLRGHPRLDVHGERMAPAALGLRQAVVGDSEAGTMVEAVAPYRLGVAEPAHRDDRSRPDHLLASSAAEAGGAAADRLRCGAPSDSNDPRATKPTRPTL